MASMEPFIYYANSMVDFPLLNTDAEGQGLDPFDAGVPRFPDTRSVLTGTIQQTQIVFSSLVDKKPINGTLVVFGESCDLSGTEEHARNCTQACTDPYLLYATWESQWTCLTLASLAVAWPSVSLNHSTKQAIDDVFGTIDGTNISSFDGAGVFDVMRSCGMVGCHDDSCTVDYLPSNNEPSFYSDGNEITEITALDPYSSGLWKVCNAVRVIVSNDISGPGVTVSYIIQVILSMFSWFLIALIAIVRNDTKERAPQYHCEYEGNTQQTWALRIHFIARFLRLVCSRLSHASSTLLVEFQEAQCFFIIAVTVAQIFASSQDPDFNETDSPASLIFQYNRIMGLAAMGMQCIALTQAGLRHARLSSMYSLVWATLAAALAGAAGGSLLQTEAQLVQRVFSGNDDTGVHECGGTSITLRDMCVVDSSDRPDTNISFINASIVVALTFILLWSKKLCRMVSKSEWARRQMPGCRWFQMLTSAKASHIASTTATLILAFLELILFSFTLISCIEKQKPSKTLTNGSWTIGQIIAMLIWAPIISKYLYLVIFGVQKGFEMRMSNDFGVHNKADQADLIDRATRYDKAQEGQRGGLY